MLVFLQSEWEPILKLYGPLGVVFLLAVMGFIGGARWLKSFITDTLADARKDRDAARLATETQANRFLDSLTKRDEIMEKGFDEILYEIRNQHPRRK